VADDATVAGVLLAAHHALADEAVDVAGDGRRIDAELLGQRADGQAVFVAQRPEQPHLRDRQAVFGPALDAQRVDDADGIAVEAGDVAELVDAPGVGGFGYVLLDRVALDHMMLALPEIFALYKRI